MSKAVFSFLFALIVVFILPIVIPSRADEPASCITDPPNGSCSDTVPCCQYYGRGERKCDRGYCVEVKPAVAPGPTANGSISISPIGDLNPGDAKSVTVSGLNANITYSWIVKKKTQAVYLPGQDPYSVVGTNCYDTDSGGQIIKDIGPYTAPGFYRLEVSKDSANGGVCVSSGTALGSQDFSIGGPLNKPGAPECCDPTWTYDRDKDFCKSLPWTAPGFSVSSKQTECSKKGSFCEPESLQCFKTKSKVVAGKICRDPAPGSEFDLTSNPPKGTDKYVVCASAGGLKIIGCTDDPSHPAIATAVGCIHTNPAEFAKDLLTFLLGIGGGLAFLMMLLGAFQMLTSAGNPETLNAGKDRLTSAVIGLLFIIFTILLLQIIGVSILNIPGFK